MNKVETKKTGGYTTIMETYKNYNEFIATQNKRPFEWTNPEVGGGKHYRDAKGDDWRGCKSFDEAQTMLTHGYDENVGTMIKRVGELQKQGVSHKTKRYADVVGYAPIVPNAIMGLPNSMLNSKKVDIQNKVITILYCPEVSVMVSAEEVTEFGCRFINAVMNLERCGYRVRIDFLNVFTDEYYEKQYILRVPVKNEHQPVNIKRLSFPLTHVGMQRYLCFDWFEHVPHSAYIGGLGSPIGKCDSKARTNFREMLKDNEYLVLYGDDIETKFKQIDN